MESSDDHAFVDSPGAIAPAIPVSAEDAGTAHGAWPETGSAPYSPAGVSVWLDSRNPFSLVAHWNADETTVQTILESRSNPILRLRITAHHLGGPIMADQVVTSATRHRLVPVLYANTEYVAELGYFDVEGTWNCLAVSSPTRTPPDSHVPEWANQTAVYPALRRPPPVGAAELTAAARSKRSRAQPAPEPMPNRSSLESGGGIDPDAAAEALTALVWDPTPVVIPIDSSASVHQWTAHLMTTARVVPSESAPSPTSAGLAGPGNSEAAGREIPSSPARPAAPAPTEFWFKVNAELILYGSTEPDAAVTLAGRPVPLRDDGSFTFRFSLPDGDYSLPAQAVNAAGTDQRTAFLRFQRTTERSGDVGVHPQDSALSPPVAESIR